MSSLVRSASRRMSKVFRSSGISKHQVVEDAHSIPLYTTDAKELKKAKQTIGKLLNLAPITVDALFDFCKPGNGGQFIGNFGNLLNLSKEELSRDLGMNEQLAPVISKACSVYSLAELQRNFQKQNSLQSTVSSPSGGSKEKNAWTTKHPSSASKHRRKKSVKKQPRPKRLSNNPTSSSSSRRSEFVSAASSFEDDEFFDLAEQEEAEAEESAAPPTPTTPSEQEKSFTRKKSRAASKANLATDTEASEPTRKATSKSKRRSSRTLPKKEEISECSETTIERPCSLPTDTEE